jgi:hypothetical protein
MRTRDLAALWLYLELFAFLGRRGRRARVEVPPRLSAAAARGCLCSSCDRERAAA